MFTSFGKLFWWKRRSLRAATFIAGMTLLPAWNSLAQQHAVAIIVDGSPLVGTRPPVRQDGEWSVPLAPMARALGARLQITADQHALQVERRDGTDVTYDQRTGEIRQGYVLVGQLHNFSHWPLTTLNDDVLFPLSGIVALLGVSVEEDYAQSALRIESESAVIGNGSSWEPHFTLANFSYDYGLTTNGSQNMQFVNLRSKGMTKALQVDGRLELTRFARHSHFSLSQGSVRLAALNGGAMTLGDQSPYIGLDAFTTTVRGIGLDLSTGRWKSLFYAGPSAIASLGALGGSVTQFDGKTLGLGLRRQSGSSELSLGAHRFNGSGRTGTAAGIGYSAVSSTNQMKGQFSAGTFSGQSEGRSYGFTLAEAFTPIKAVSLNGHIEHYGKAFSSPREDLRFSGQSNRMFSVTVRPSPFITFNTGVNDRVSLAGDAGDARSYHYGSNASLPFSQPVQISFFRSTQTESNHAGQASVTLYSAAAPNVRELSAHVQYSEIVVNNIPSRTVNTTIAKDYKRRGRVTFHDQLQLQMNHRWGFDWLVPFPARNGFVRIGLDRLTNSENGGLIPQAAVKLGLPGGHSFQLSYLGERNSHTLQLQIGGTIFREDTTGSANRSASTAVILAELTGRIYFDSDNDGQFTPGSDRTLGDVSVWLDNTNQATTNTDGSYRFHHVTPGAHAVRADLTGVPAEMVFADAAERTIAVLPRHTNAQNFRVVRTGQVTGKVSYIDYVTDPEEPAERPLPDVRLIASSDYDTYSEVNGHFIIGDLPPGTYEIKVDPATVPAGYVAQPATAIVAVEPGEVRREVSFVLVIPPKPVLERLLPPQGINNN